MHHLKISLEDFNRLMVDEEFRKGVVESTSAHSLRTIKVEGDDNLNRFHLSQRGFTATVEVTESVKVKFCNDTKYREAVTNAMLAKYHFCKSVYLICAKDSGHFAKLNDYHYTFGTKVSTSLEYTTIKGEPLIYRVCLAHDASVDYSLDNDYERVLYLGISKAKVDEILKLDKLGCIVAEGQVDLEPALVPKSVSLEVQVFKDSEVVDWYSVYLTDEYIAKYNEALAKAKSEMLE